jgi:hypothetical protein
MTYVLQWRPLFASPQLKNKKKLSPLFHKNMRVLNAINIYTCSSLRHLPRRALDFLSQMLQLGFVREQKNGPTMQPIDWL